MRLFDCTLRDGANVVGNGFDALLTRSMLHALLKCGITEIELGNAKGLGAYEKLNAVAPLTDKEYMELIAADVEKGHLGMFQLAAIAEPECIRMAADHGLNFLRVGNDAGQWRESVQAVKMVKEAGLMCRYSLMKAYVSTPEELAEEAHALEQAGVDRITIMDSAGTMLPDETAAYVAAMKQRVSIPVGFHGHSNLGLSQANALMAVAAGAEEIDCGLLGMARSAGNCSTELAAAAFQRIGMLSDVDLYGLLDYLERELIPQMEAYQYHPAVSPVDLILGLTGTHSSFLNRMRAAAQAENISLFRLITEVARIDRKTPSQELIEQTAKQIYAEQ